IGANHAWLTNQTEYLANREVVAATGKTWQEIQPLYVQMWADKDGTPEKAWFIENRLASGYKSLARHALARHDPGAAAEYSKITLDYLRRQGAFRRNKPGGAPSAEALDFISQFGGFESRWDELTRAADRARQRMGRTEREGYAEFFAELSGRFSERG